MTPAPLCHDGSPVRSPRRRSLRAGPLEVEYGDGELRYVRLGDREVIRRLYVAVRDPNWGTVPGRIADEVIDVEPEGFRIRFAMEHRDGPIDFAWLGTIDGDADGTLRFRMDGQARTTFRRNRIGFCVLHPIRECAGARVRYRLRDGTKGESAFPRSISPRNPFRELRGLAHELSPGTWAELEFEGDLFETEDQRNWIDASFKTFCTPLRLPFPVLVEAGARVEQAVTLRLDGPGRPSAIEPVTSEVAVVVAREEIGALPDFGLGLTGDTPPLTDREADLLRELNPNHLRVDLRLADPDSGERLRRATEQCRRIGCGLELALTVSDRAEAELDAFVGLFETIRPLVHRWLIFHEREWSTPVHWIRLARDRLPAIAPIYSGTTANYRELNGGRPPVELLDGVCFSAQPQEHASDNTSLVETPAALRDAIESAREFCGRLPLAVTPITFRKRANPYATGSAPPAPSDGLPPRVDPRQMSLLGAGWTLGVLKALAEGGASSATWYETIGWLGVMESASGCPRPDLFPSRPGMAYPLYHVLRDANEWPRAPVIDARSSRPLRVAALALASDSADAVRLLVANLTDEPVTVAVSGLGSVARVRILDETTFERATGDPEAFVEDGRERRATDDGRLKLDLRPFAYARIDTD